MKIIINRLLLIFVLVISFSVLVVDKKSDFCVDYIRVNYMKYEY